MPYPSFRPGNPGKPKPGKVYEKSYDPEYEIAWHEAEKLMYAIEHDTFSLLW